MGDLSVSVWFNGELVEDRVLTVDRVVRIGEGPGAEVSFPGADVAVVRMGDRLAVRGRQLEEGEEVRISLGPVEVAVEHTVRANLPGEWAGLWDRRFFAAALLVTAVGAWFDALDLWLEDLPQDSPELLADLHHLLPVAGEASSRSRAAALPAGADGGLPLPSATPVQIADGPRHLPDDHLTGMGWCAWYRNEVPADDQALEAYDRLALEPTDASARRVLARSAYNADDFAEAAWHYRWLLRHHADDRDARFRLAQAEGRRGNHRIEADLYRSLLDEDPDNLLALSGLSVALVRLNRLDEAVILLDELAGAAPESPLTELTSARVEALLGHDNAALEALDRAFTSREQLSQELQLEFRRDLALDPAFASLRKDRRLRSVVHRHLGAAGPRPAR